MAGRNEDQRGREGAVNAGACLEDIEDNSSRSPPDDLPSECIPHAVDAITPNEPPPPYDGWSIEPPRYTPKANDSSPWVVSEQPYNSTLNRGGDVFYPPAPLPQYTPGPAGAAFSANMPFYNYGGQGPVVVVNGVDPRPLNPLTDPPNDYMSCAIFVTVCCCWIVGLSAIQRSRECRQAIALGDRSLAETKSREARNRVGYSMCFGIVCVLIVAGILGIRYGLMYPH